MTSNRKIKRRLQSRLSKLPLHLMAMDARMGESKIFGMVRLPKQERHLYYIFKSRSRFVPVPFWKFHQWMSQTGNGGRATVTIARSRAGDYTVSTIFLGLNHAFGGGDPVLFETMAYVARPDGKSSFRNEQYRYRTWADAIRGHRQFAARLATLKRVK